MTLFDHMYPLLGDKAATSTAIIDTINAANYGVIALPQSCLQDIFKRSGPLATSSEFQVDYWNLVFRHTFADSSIFDVAVPLAFFNYPQEVSGARIDFEMKDVSDISSQLQPVANKLAGDVLATSFPIDLAAAFNLTFEPLLVPLNTIHRHPGGSAHQGFSGTDLTKNAAEHGVVYPWKVAEADTSNFAGIMAIDAGICNLAHMEYRLVTGTLGTDIHYKQGNCAAFSFITKQQSQAQALLSSESTLSVVQKTKGNIHDSAAATLKQLYSELFSLFTPMTDFVFAEHVTARAYTHVTYRSPSKKAKVTTHTTDELKKMDINVLRALLKATAFQVAEDIYTHQELIEYTSEQIIEELEVYYTHIEKEKATPIIEVEEFTFHTISALDKMEHLDLRVYLNKLAKYVNNEEYPLKDTVSFSKDDIISEIITYYQDHHANLKEKEVTKSQPTEFYSTKHDKQSKKHKRITYDPLKGWYKH